MNLSTPITTSREGAESARLHPLIDFVADPEAIAPAPIHYWYEGRCPHQGTEHRLPRTPLVEAIARQLMRHLADDASLANEGKMYGVLLVQTPTGQRAVLKAFSGLLHGQRTVPGWVPPIPGHEQVALAEAQTLAQLDAIKQQLLTLQHLPERQQYVEVQRSFEQQLRELGDRHRERKQARHQTRPHLHETLTGDALTQALDALERQSQQDGLERRRLKQLREQALHSLRQVIEQADAEVRSLKQQRKTLSRQLQTQMHTTYWMTNFSGMVRPLHRVMATDSIPTGTGECCAPKLLHYAALHHLQPLALAEFWWGLPSRDRVAGEFYGACAERCQPLMGFLLSGLPQRELAPGVMPLASDASLPILYEDDGLIVVDKPAGLLSVPGRDRHHQDSVLSRLRQTRSDGPSLMAVHRLDQATSGVLLIARDRDSYRLLSQQFQQRQVHKVYEAVVAGDVDADQGEIDLPLWGDPCDRPYQTVDWQRGKPSLTRFHVLARTPATTRVEFQPLTGRTHQLRVHAAHPQGLGCPIVGDRLYGASPPHSTEGRLLLHARELVVNHPQTHQRLYLTAAVPF